MLCEKIDLALSPIEALRRARDLPGLCLLHSGLQAYGLGRYSILVAGPWKTFRYASGVATVSQGGVVRETVGDVYDLLRAELGFHGSPPPHGLPFGAGAIGYFSYDLDTGAVAQAAAEARFAFYGGALVFDHQVGQVYAVSAGPEWDEGLLALKEALAKDARPSRGAFSVDGPLRSNFAKAQYLEAVEGVRSSIREGEVYQVNLSQRFEAPCSGDPMDLFCRLARLSPAPYAAFMDWGDEAIVSSSPERFVHVNSGMANTRPIKGTRPVGRDERETRDHERDLRASEKDRSELLMIVDLERNDLGRVCVPGSVAVENLFALERYATVIHQTAIVKGELESGFDALDCIRAMFPGGSITGAPKIRARQVIRSFEGCSRGIYTGSLGYLDCSGNADFNIAIRTLRVADGRVSFSVGGGIVWDSEPEHEYEETLVKARAMVASLGKEPCYEDYR